MIGGFIAISFFAGILTVLAPCILPLLPVIVGSSALEGGSARRVFVIVLSLGASVLLFTLLLKVSTAFIYIPALFWQLLSGILIILFGFATLFPSLWDRIPGVSALYRGSNKMLGSGYQKKSLWGDAIIGAALGPVFSSCSPTYFVILAAVLPANFAVGVSYLLAYTVGLCAFLFLIALLGQKAALRLGFVASSNSWFKKAIGVLFIIIGITIIFGWDKKLEAALPAGSYAEVGIEQQLLANQQSSNTAASSTLGLSPAISNSTSTTQASNAESTFLSIAQKESQYPLAPELVSPDGYINTGGQPISLAQYRGKDVVLIDFWDYSCINCQRTIPYLNAWYQKYKDQGLVIIGVHTPEFAFEHLQSNVQAAVDQFGIKYPVVLDNEYRTWTAYQNEYWPNEYLIDIDGFIVHNHAGEGDYDGTEQAIQQALAERAARLGLTTSSTSTVNIPEQDLSAIQSPETYFGANRNEYLGNGTQGAQGTQALTIPNTITASTLYLGGTWNFASEYAETGPGAKIIYQYSARDVYMVATNPSAPVILKILRDGKPVGAAYGGADVDPSTSEVTISGDRLYKLIHDPTPGTHTIEIDVEQGTLDAYTFTFG